MTKFAKTVDVVNIFFKAATSSSRLAFCIVLQAAGEAQSVTSQAATGA